MVSEEDKTTNRDEILSTFLGSRTPLVSARLEPLLHRQGDHGRDPRRPARRGDRTLRAVSTAASTTTATTSQTGTTGTTSPGIPLMRPEHGLRAGPAVADAEHEADQRSRPP